MNRTTTTRSISRLVVLAAIAAGTLTTPNVAQADDGCGCKTIREDVSTGRDVTGGILNAPASDQNWSMVSDPLGNPGPANVINPHPVWVNGGPTARWINGASSALNGTLPGGTVSTLPGMWEFEIDFTIDTGTHYPSLFLNYSADDGIEFLLNGNSIGGTAFPQVPPTWANQYTLSHSGAFFNNGPNTLTARVENWILWSGFFVEGTVIGECLNAGGGPGVYSVDVRTGYDDSASSLMSQGTVDDDWTLTSPAGPAYAIEPDPYLAGAWGSGLPNARWISLQNSTMPSASQGNYVYADAVELPCDPPLRCVEATVRLTYRADNEVTFSLDGAVIGSSPSNAFSSTHSLTRTVPCSAAANASGFAVLEADVYNSGSYTGLAVEGTIEFLFI